ncbi:MAG: hypothetical protein ACFFFT_11225 [Candidatus Thorarchaeota archaeon]
MNLKRFILLITLVFLLVGHSYSQSNTVFSGIPTFKISEGGVERVPEAVSREKAINLGCLISEIGGKYYWTTRENKELILNESGAFITFTAIDGCGYVRIIPPEMKKAASLMSPTEEKFDYVEHLLIGLRSVTYYGIIK